ncbi:MAG: EamA family transporter, partial [Caulobacteraceae bacterium]
YCLALVRAYRDGLLAEVYPIARGSSPMLVTLGAFVFAHERLGLAELAGVALVSIGILGVAIGRGAPRLASLFAALTTGLLISCYTVTDGLGGRASGAAVSYACWLFLIQGAAMPFVYLAVRRRWPTLGLDAETLKSAIGGTLSLLAYGVVIWALSFAPMGQVSALRETGILFAMVIGVLFLKERPSSPQLFAAAVIAAGAALLA